MAVQIVAEVMTIKKLVVAYDRGTKELTVKTRKGRPIIAFSNEKHDSGAYVGSLPKGQVVIQLDRNEQTSNIIRSLIRNDIIRLVGEPWATWGARYTTGRRSPHLAPSLKGEPHVRHRFRHYRGSPTVYSE